jgi:hypothetical protein
MVVEVFKRDEKRWRVVDKAVLAAKVDDVSQALRNPSQSMFHGSS